MSNPNAACNIPEEYKWKPGQCGNPAGKPKGSKHLSTILKELLYEELEYDDPISKKRVKSPIAKIINMKLLAKAIKDGSIPAIQEIYDRTEGKAPQEIKTENDHNINKVTVEIVDNNESSDKSNQT